MSELPCGTPQITVWYDEIVSTIETYCCQFVRYFEDHFRGNPLIPFFSISGGGRGGLIEAKSLFELYTFETGE